MTRRCEVFKIRPGQKGYGTPEAAAWPWHVRPVGSSRGWAFPTWEQARYFAFTGETLRVSREFRAWWTEQHREMLDSHRVKRNRG